MRKKILTVGEDVRSVRISLREGDGHDDEMRTGDEEEDRRIVVQIFPI